MDHFEPEQFLCYLPDDVVLFIGKPVLSPQLDDFEAVYVGTRDSPPKRLL